MWVCPGCHFSVSPLLVEGSASKGKARPKLCLRKSLTRGRAHGGRERTASPRVYFSPRKAQQNLEGAGRLDGASPMLERHSEHPRGAGPRSEGPRALRDPHKAYSSFCLRAVIAVTVLREPLCLSGDANGGGRRGVSKMSYHQRPHELRLAISSEVEALISDFGGEAYVEARRRAKEASSDFLARDWSEVALVITRKTGKRSSVLARLFH